MGHVEAGVLAVCLRRSWSDAGEIVYQPYSLSHIYDSHKSFPQRERLGVDYLAF